MCKNKYKRGYFSHHLTNWFLFGKLNCIRNVIWFTVWDHFGIPNCSRPKIDTVTQSVLPTSIWESVGCSAYIYDYTTYDIAWTIVARLPSVNAPVATSILLPSRPIPSPPDGTTRLDTKTTKRRRYQHRQVTRLFQLKQLPSPYQGGHKEIPEQVERK